MGWVPHRAGYKEQIAIVDVLFLGYSYGFRAPGGVSMLVSKSDPPFSVATAGLENGKGEWLPVPRAKYSCEYYNTVMCSPQRLKYKHDMLKICLSKCHLNKCL